jgi:hypothetical protein
MQTWLNLKLASNFSKIQNFGKVNELKSTEKIQHFCNIEALNYPDEVFCFTSFYFTALFGFRTIAPNWRLG